MSTETKVVSSIVLLTLAIIIGGIFIIGKKSNTPQNLNLQPELLSRTDAPRTGTNTKVTIVEFADFQCPACSILNPSLEKLLQTDGDKFTLVYRHFPLHAYSYEAAGAALAAGEQGKFFEMGALLYEHQDAWSAPSADRPALFESYAKQLGLDMTAFKASAKDSKHRAIVDRDKRDAVAMGINSTPTLVINGTQAVRGAIPYDTLRKLVYEAAGLSTSTATSTR